MSGTSAKGLDESGVFIEQSGSEGRRRKFRRPATAWACGRQTNEEGATAIHLTLTATEPHRLSVISTKSDAMPNYRSINVALHSQFDIETFPEYAPQPQEYYAQRGIAGKVPPLIDEKTATCSVYIPVFPGSQFWISYSVSPPVPDDQQFLFKLFINGAHVVSWSAGRAQDWKGKTMFGLYEKECEDGKKRVEKRVLCFTPPDKKTKQWTDVIDAFDEDAYMEIRVHRAHRSKRIERDIKEFKDTEHGKRQRGIE
jgi:hypothetical protein